MTTSPNFPPLFRGESVSARTDPFAKAVSLAITGTDPGLICWSEDEAAMRAAVILSPEMQLDDAIGATFAVSIGLSDALGALAPPEVAVHFSWPDGFKVNGARCGKLRAAASIEDPTKEPDWLVVGVDIPILPVQDIEPGQTPDQTTLVEEGCADITAQRLLESWSRHTLVWINTLLDDGFAKLHRDWCGRCDDIGEDIDHPKQGTFVGLDEKGGMLLRNGDATSIIPLTHILGEHR